MEDATSFYNFTVNERKYSIQYLRLTYVEGYDDAQLARLCKAHAYDVSFYQDGPNGYGVTGTGRAFQVLGGVANGMLDWAKQHQPDYLHWYAIERNRQRLYDRMCRYFEAKGAGYRRVPDPFTGRQDPGVFWLERVVTG